MILTALVVCLALLVAFLALRRATRQTFTLNLCACQVMDWGQIQLLGVLLLEAVGTRIGAARSEGSNAESPLRRSLRSSEAGTTPIC